jgi:hypothetical protein
MDITQVLPLTVVVITPVEGTAGTDLIDIQPPIDEVWILHHVYASHNDVAAKDMAWLWQDDRESETATLCAVISTAAAVKRILFADTDLATPQVADVYSYPQAQIAGLQAGKFISAWALVSIIKGRRE